MRMNFFSRRGARCLGRNAQGLRRVGVLVIIGVTGFAGFVPQGAAARDFTAGEIIVSQPWSRATPGSSKVAVGYLSIRNSGDTPDRLKSASTEVSEKTSAHTMAMNGDMMVMRPMEDGVLVPAHGTVSFEPGSNHLMLEGLRRPLKKGETFSGTLTFEKAGAVPVIFQVEAIGARAPSLPH